MFAALLNRAGILAGSFLVVATVAFAQGWATTTTKAFPVQYLPGATLVGPLAPATTVHVVRFTLS